VVGQSPDARFLRLQNKLDRGTLRLIVRLPWLLTLMHLGGYWQCRDPVQLRRSISAILPFPI
jgi:hypothetical protein